MSDIINLLPDSVANQIAAGEVIQRPASVVKELVENSIDSGATQIKIIIKDAGKTLIQIIDNGCGMSETDCRMAFERHATSKIKKANDLFAIHTMGFRGEALASIAAIARVELKTKLFDDELGTHLIISGSKVESQNVVNCPNGSNFIIKDLFFNVPARRKFLKKDTTEFYHIITEFKRVSLSNPAISFTLIHNENIIYNLPPSNHKLRITNIFGKSINQNLLSVDNQSSFIKLTGFIGTPKLAKKNFGEQFFFVNNRFMKHSYFHKAVVLSYENIIAPDLIPAYFLFLEIDAAEIDINIHPTKTEIKFEDEASIWQIIRLVAKETLGKFNIVPAIDFTNELPINIPILNKDTKISTPTIEINSEYNPFDKQTEKKKENPFQFDSKKLSTNNWEKLYEGVKNDFDVNISPDEFNSQMKINTFAQFEINKNIIQVKNKYILLPVKSGLMIIDQKKAHERIYYEYFHSIFDNKKFTIQKLLFPIKIELTPDYFEIFKEINSTISSLGFSFELKESNIITINGLPSIIEIPEPEKFLNLLIENYKETEHDITEKIKDSVIISIAKTASINYGTSLSTEEMNSLVDRLFACKLPNYSPTGKTIVTILKTEEIEKKFENNKDS